MASAGFMQPIAEEMRPEMVLLGTGTSNGVPMIGCHCEVCRSGNPKNKRTRSGVLVQAPEGNFLIDTPPELRLQLVRENIDLARAVVFTHGHADHLYGLDDTRLFSYYLKQVIPLYCEADTERRIRQSFDYAFTNPYPKGHFGAVPQLEIHSIGVEAFDL